MSTAFVRIPQKAKFEKEMDEESSITREVIPGSRSEEWENQSRMEKSQHKGVTRPMPLWATEAPACS